MDYTNNNTESRKNKHLNFEERKTRNALVRKIPSKTSEAVMNELMSIHSCLVINLVKFLKL
ncbi:hypothetical protein U732_1677 [Clostridium argentinense CDC 2741]|uniref:Uncharacterized protein n=1 Tax=Clostridium argentinense CDC 2741 TaxID=1418104 RepID=A0A0C1R6T0_9CLOT|nr:hypothetical protein RSJ17_17130 [Clostridium argentinense]KIE46206.1 hypothetical protein U732_1677 [Clostridium argentinense CDC 2741]